MEDSDQTTHFRSNTGVHLPKFLLEPQSLSAKKVNNYLIIESIKLHRLERYDLNLQCLFE